MEKPSDENLDRSGLLSTLIRELTDVVELAAVLNCADLVQRLKDAHVEANRFYTEALLEKRFRERG
jgi:hypothetical protein